jgi:threonine synthase
MPAIPFLECSRCRHHLFAEIWPTVCPLCGGSFYVRYDMDQLRRSTRCQDIPLRADAFPCSLGIGRYACVLPDVPLITLGEGNTPLIISKRHPSLYLKDEGANPTGSVAARGIAFSVSMAKNYGLKHVAIASLGNSAAALAAYAAAAGLNAHVFLPTNAPQADYLQAMLHGAHVTPVDGLIEASLKKLDEFAQTETQLQTAANFSSQKQPFRLEGEKTLGYELTEQLGWQYPAAILCPEDINLIALHKAFTEIEQLGWVEQGSVRPKLYAIHSSMQGRPDEDLALKIVAESGARLIEVSNEEISRNIREWAQHQGTLLSPQGSSATAAYNQLLATAELQPTDKTVAINPASALKYLDATAAALHLRPTVTLPTSLPVGGIITPQ